MKGGFYIPVTEYNKDLFILELNNLILIVSFKYVEL